MSDPAPKRRWFRFSLRTFFVVVTILAVWLGYQINWIRQRRDVRASTTISIPILCFVTEEASDAPPWPLAWFGEKSGGPEWVLPATTSDEELARVQKLFPETLVTRLHDWKKHNR